MKIKICILYLVSNTSRIFAKTAKLVNHNGSEALWNKLRYEYSRWNLVWSVVRNVEVVTKASCVCFCVIFFFLTFVWNSPRAFPWKFVDISCWCVRTMSKKVKSAFHAPRFACSKSTPRKMYQLSPTTYSVSVISSDYRLHVKNSQLHALRYCYVNRLRGLWSRKNTWIEILTSAHVPLMTLLTLSLSWSWS